MLKDIINREKLSVIAIELIWYYSGISMPTMRQKAVAIDLLENTGKPVSTAMLDAGYAPGTAKNPMELTESKGWHELLEQYFPDTVLAQVGTDGLNATKIISSHTEPDYEVPDHAVRYKYWDRILDIKGKIPKQTTGVEITEGDKSIRVVVQDYK